MKKARLHFLFVVLPIALTALSGLIDCAPASKSGPTPLPELAPPTAEPQTVSPRSRSPGGPRPAASPKPRAPRKPERGQRPRPTPPHRPQIRKPWKLPQGFYEAAVWGARDSRRPWTEAVIHATWRLRADLEEARDIEDFCPGYERAKKRERSICWLRLISAMALEESQFKPRMTYREPMGMLSIGLLQLSNGECTLNGDPSPDLTDPIKNLKCGIAIMAHLIKRDRYIDGPIWGRGAAAYWSTLRKPYVFLGMRLGKRQTIENHTKNYRDFPTE